jgi:hypothetical protein
MHAATITARRGAGVPVRYSTTATPAATAASPAHSACSQSSAASNARGTPASVGWVRSSDRYVRAAVR